MTDLAMRVDLNADLGEGCPWDADLLARVSSASISCGAHAGSPEQIVATLRQGGQGGVVLGGHPGFPDREGFGRREQPIDRAGAETLVRQQVQALQRLAGPLGVTIRFLKPHGALYNQAQRDPEIAAGVVAAAGALGLPVLGQPHGAVEAAARAAGLRFVAEGFADRRYGPDGRLRPRSEPGALLTDPAEIAAQVRQLIAQGVETLCVHGDHAGSVPLADLVRRTLDQAGVAIRSFV